MVVGGTFRTIEAPSRHAPKPQGSKGDHDSTIGIGALSYLVPTFALGFVWHLVAFKGYYDALAMYRQDVIIPFGFLAMALQAVFFAWLFDNAFARDPVSNWRRGVYFAAFGAVLSRSFTTPAVAAKNDMTSVVDYLMIESAFTIVRWAIVGPLVALALSSYERASRMPRAEGLKRRWPDQCALRQRVRPCPHLSNSRRKERQPSAHHPVHPSRGVNMLANDASTDHCVNDHFARVQRAPQLTGELVSKACPPYDGAHYRCPASSPQHQNHRSEVDPFQLKRLGHSCRVLNRWIAPRNVGLERDREWPTFEHKGWHLCARGGRTKD